MKKLLLELVIKSLLHFINCPTHTGYGSFLQKMPYSKNLIILLTKQLFIFIFYYSIGAVCIPLKHFNFSDMPSKYLFYKK